MNLTRSKYCKTEFIISSENVRIFGKNFFMNLNLFPFFILLILIINSSKIFLLISIREILVLAIKLYLKLSLTKCPYTFPAEIVLINISSFPSSLLSKKSISPYKINK